MKYLEVSLIASLLGTILLAMPASEAQSSSDPSEQAQQFNDPPQGDQYDHGPALAAAVTSDVIATEGRAESGDEKKVSHWYKRLDSLVEPLLPSDSDKVILTRDINMDSDRLKEHLLVTFKLRNNYMRIAYIYRNAPLPPAGAKLNDLRTYKKLAAEWYEDAAEVCNDMVRPRVPCQTIEELEAAIAVVDGKAESLEKTAAALADMDSNLRRQFKIPRKSPAFTPDHS